MREFIGIVLRKASAEQFQWSGTLRVALLRLKYPNLETSGRVLVGKGCSFSIHPTSHVSITGCVIHHGTTISTASHARLEINADYVGPNCVVVARDSILIGPETKIAEMSVIRDANHDLTVPLSTMRFVTQAVEIGAGVWLGARAVVLPGVRIGDGAVVGAGAVVTKSVAPHTTVVGVPARATSARVPSTAAELQ
jgi:acetyltransferase-like isoleucine patch superfamily enzyme